MGRLSKQWSATGRSVAANLRSKQCTKRNRPGAPVIAGHRVGHSTSAKTTDQAAGVAALDLLLGCEGRRAVGLIAWIASWIPPEPWRCAGLGIVLNAPVPTGLWDRPGPRRCRKGKPSRGHHGQGNADARSRAQVDLAGSRSAHDGLGVWEEASEPTGSTACTQPNPNPLVMRD